jgi:hypothetical protein
MPASVHSQWLAIYEATLVTVGQNDNGAGDIIDSKPGNRHGPNSVGGAAVGRMRQVHLGVYPPWAHGLDLYTPVPHPAAIVRIRPIESCFEVL